MKRTLLFIVLLLLAAAGAFRYSKARTHQLFGTIVPRVETEQKVVALTFDDGPTDYVIDEILRALGGAKATFFVIGAELQHDPSLAPRLIDAGNQISNHNFHH